MTDDEFKEAMASIYENLIPSVIYKKLDPRIKSNYPRDIASSYFLAGKDCAKMVLRSIDPDMRAGIVGYIEKKYPEIKKYNYD